MYSLNIQELLSTCSLWLFSDKWNLHHGEERCARRWMSLTLGIPKHTLLLRFLSSPQAAQLLRLGRNGLTRGPPLLLSFSLCESILMATSFLPSFHPHIYPSIHPSMHLCIHACIHPSMHLSIFASSQPSTHLFFHPSIQLIYLLSTSYGTGAVKWWAKRI